MALTVSCGLISSSTPATSLPTPPATDEPTIGPTLDWTTERIKRDWLAEQLSVEVDAIARDVWGSEYSNPFIRRGIDTKTMYVPSYMATTCIEGTKPSVEGFNTYMRGAISDGKDSDAEAKRAIQAIIAAHEKGDKQSLYAVTQHCLQPYLYPNSASDAKPAVDLKWALEIKRVGSLFRESAEMIKYSSVTEWLAQAGDKQPFMIWVCGQYSDNWCGL